MARLQGFSAPPINTGTSALRGTLLKVLPEDPVSWCRLFCIAFGPFLLLDGLTALLFVPTGLATSDQLPREEWNFFFHFNDWHQLLHVVNGLVLTSGAIRRSWAPLAALVFGLAYAVMAPIGFVDGNDIFDIFYSGTPENLIHTVFAISGVTLGALGMRSPRRTSRRDGSVQRWQEVPTTPDA